jgi:hypothetical protein
MERLAATSHVDDAQAANPQAASWPGRNVDRALIGSTVKDGLDLGRNLSHLDWFAV